MKQWTDKEWFFCLSCFYNSSTLDQALSSFSSHYKRTKTEICKKLEIEQINLLDYLGAGLKNSITKRQLIRELKQVYKILGTSFTQKQFNEFSHIKSHTVIGYFGGWEIGLEEAGLLKKFNNYNSLIEQIQSFDPTKELDENWKKEKQQLLHKAEQRKIKYLREQSQKCDIVNEMIKEAVAKADPLIVDVTVVKKITKYKSKSRLTLWFEFSDLQLGTLITLEEMGGLTQHNWVIWQEKLNIWKMQVIEKIDTYKKNHQIDRVVIGCLGDMVEGQDIFKSQLWRIDSNVIDQAINGANDTAAAFTEIFLTHHDIHFDIFEVFGNHGRVGAKGESPYNCSMDKVFQRMLQGQLEKVTHLKNYAYHQNEAWFYFVEIYGWNHLLLHGDQGMSKLWSNKPTINGLEKGLTRYNQMFQQQIHFIHCGHFHSDVAMSFNLSQILINGSFIGTSTFSASQMVASSPPIQVLHVFEPRSGLYATERILLSTEQAKKSLEPKKLDV